MFFKIILLEECFRQKKIDSDLALIGAIRPCADQFHAVDAAKDGQVWREKPRTGESIVLVLKPRCFPESADAVGRGGRRRIAHGQSSIGLEHEVFRGPGKTRAKRLYVQDAHMEIGRANV